MNNNATAPHRNAPPIPLRRRNSITVRRPGMFSIRIRHSFHPYRSYTRSTTISLETFSSLSVIEFPSLRPPMVPPEIHPLNNISTPQQHEIDIEAFHRMWPSFDGMPLRYIRDALSESKGNQMLHNARNTIVRYLNREEPYTCEVLFNGSAHNDDVVPSHVLEVHQGSDMCAKLFPVHQIIFAANCATLPNFPNSPCESHNLSITITLPVVRLEVPSLKSFCALYHYLYTKNMNLLRQSLSPPSDAQSTISNLYQQTESIRDLWKTACALSVVDIGLYVFMQESYTEAQNAIRRIEMGYF